MIMKKTISVLILSSIIFVGCSIAKKVEVVGEARDAKAGATIKTESNIYLYIDKKDRWPIEVLNKKVQVKGRLVATIDTTSSFGISSVGQRVQVYLLIKHPKVKILDK